jgi:hypothetical protein
LAWPPPCGAIRSETSNRIYGVSQHANKRYWACSCPAWRTRRHRKHLTQLGLPGGEEPFEVKQDHAKGKGFMDCYKTYDDSQGHGSKGEWQQVFSHRMNLDEARAVLGLPEQAGWDEVRQACQLAATESMSRLVGDYERATQAFDGSGPVEERAQAVKLARFRIEAYLAYLEEQKQNLEREAKRVTQTLLSRIEAL